MKSVRNFLVIPVLILSVWINTGCGGVTPIKTSTSTIIPTLTHTSTPKPLATATPVANPTSSTSNRHTTISMQNECRVLVDGLYSFKKDLILPKHFMSENPFRKTSDFDPNQYFQLFSHLSMADDYNLDYIYYKDDLGGVPLVYARKSDSAPFQSYIELLKSFGEDMSEVGLITYGHLPHQRDYLDKIQIDKSPESYFEYVTSWLLVDQFYLWQRGLYNDEKILCDSSDMKYIYEDMKSFDLEFPQNVKDKIEHIDFNPVVIVDETSITVSFVSFSKWGGFFRSAYVLEKDEPGHWHDVKYDDLIEYHCEINF